MISADMKLAATCAWVLRESVRKRLASYDLLGNEVEPMPRTQPTSNDQNYRQEHAGEAHRHE